MERRKSARGRCLIGAQIIYNDRSATMSCTVRNRSEEGCLLAFGAPSFIPDELELVLVDRNIRKPGRVAWRDGHKVGIAFPPAATTSGAGDAATPKSPVQAS